MDYYGLLGLTRDATDAEVKTAYRRLAKQFHPDSGEPSDVARFHEIQLAYEMLTDVDRRRAYDHAGAVAKGSPVSWTGGFENPLASFREVFARHPAAMCLDVDSDVVVSCDEARRGAEAVLDVPYDELCKNCRGGGLDFFGWCVDCRGEGYVRVHERICFRVPPGTQHGDVVTVRLNGGRTIRGNVRIKGPVL
jgi:DnaJ-class molecular chaperone